MINLSLASAKTHGTGLLPPTEVRSLVELIRTARMFESVPVGFRSSSLNLFRLCFKLVGYKSHLLSLGMFLGLCCLI